MALQTAGRYAFVLNFSAGSTSFDWPFVWTIQLA